MGIFDSWCAFVRQTNGHHSSVIGTEQANSRRAALKELRARVKTHFVDPQVAAARVSDLGARRTAAMLRELLPTSRTARSGDLGEILATEYTVEKLGFSVPILRLRWKDGREMALRGDDILGILSSPKMLHLLKGEVKSRSQLKTEAIEAAMSALGREGGRPNRHTVLYIATRLREAKKDTEALRLERLLSDGWSGTKISHLFFSLCGNDASSLLSKCLAGSMGSTVRNIVSIRIPDHASFIKAVFDGV